MPAILSPCWICLRLRQRPARLALEWAGWKFGVWRTSLPVLRRIRLARICSARSDPKHAPNADARRATDRSTYDSKKLNGLFGVTLGAGEINQEIDREPVH